MSGTLSIFWLKKLQHTSGFSFFSLMFYIFLGDVDLVNRKHVQKKSTRNPLDDVPDTAYQNWFRSRKRTTSRSEISELIEQEEEEDEGADSYSPNSHDSSMDRVLNQIFISPDFSSDEAEGFMSKKHFFACFVSL